MGSLAASVVAAAASPAARGGFVEWDWKRLGSLRGWESRGRKNEGRRGAPEVRRGSGVLEEKYVLETVRSGAVRLIFAVALLVAFALAVFVAVVERNRWIVRPKGRPIIDAMGVGSGIGGVYET